jgi:hypothetical protein
MPTKEEIFEFLNDLREGGTINMFSAPKVIENEFGLSKQDAVAVFWEWTNEFEKENEPSTEEII